MKPSPQHDFPVSVYRQQDSHTDEAVAAAFDGIYDVTLNFSVSINVVPTLDRSPPWPPRLPADVRDVRSVDEARRATIVLSDFVVTPDDGRAGTVETVTLVDGDKVAIFYVSSALFASLASELHSLWERLPGVHVSVPVSELGDSALALLLLGRIVPSGYLTADQLQILSR
jgi:hypothetical protein